MRREDQSTEFKETYVDDIKKTVVAFANTDGGHHLRRASTIREGS